jgi:hypothetical protein
MRAAGPTEPRAAMYPNHHIERRHVSTYSRQLAKERHLYRVVCVRLLFILFVSVELRPLTSPLSIPGCQMQHCRMKIDGEMYVPEKSLYHYHFVSHKIHMECLGSDSGNRMILIR